MSEEDTNHFNIRWKCANWKPVTADSILSDLPMVEESLAVNIHDIMMHLSTC